jgi:probable phosphoglycerate mutase
MELTRICLVRHGETAWNAEKRIQGHTDIALAESGLAQAEAVARCLPRQSVSALYTSDLLRASQTAACIGNVLGLPLSLLPSLRERCYGIFEGLTYDEARARYPVDFHALEMRDPDYAFPEGGESLRQLHARVTGQLRRLAMDHSGQLVVLVTHGGVLDIVNRFVRDNPLDTPRDFLIPNAGITWLSVSGERWTLEAWGDTAHLSAGGLDELP